MGITTPRTWVANETVTASLMNTHVRDQMQALLGVGSNTKPSCRVYNSANISVPNAALTALTFNSERWDNQAMHSTSASTSRITIPTGWGGIYLVGGNIQFAANATGQRQIVIRLNGATAIVTSGLVDAAAAGATDLSVSTIYAFSAADYIELEGYQNSTGALNAVTQSAYSPEFWAIWMGN